MATGLEDERDLDLTLCHATTDFDSLAAAVGLARWRSFMTGQRAVVVVPGGEHPSVKRFLSLHKQLLPLFPVKAVDPKRLRWVGIVDTCKKDRLGVAAEWPELAESVDVYDHHTTAVQACDIENPALKVHVDAVGATTTMVAEMLRESGAEVEPVEATLMALAIHYDTGNLTFETTTHRDVGALAWLMTQGASQRTINEFTHQMLSPEQQEMLNRGLQRLTKRTVHGLVVSHVYLESATFSRGMSTVAQDIVDLSASDILVFGIASLGKRKPSSKASPTEVQLSIIGRARARVEGIDLADLFSLYGGGGHAKAASLSTKVPLEDAEQFVVDLTNQLAEQIEPAVLVSEFMNSEFTTCGTQTKMLQVKQVLLEKDISGVTVLNDDGTLLGVITRYDVMMAELGNRSDTPVTAWVTKPCRTLPPDAPIHEAERIMAEHRIGRLPIVDKDRNVLGIVSRTDVLRQRHLV